ncbi:MAG: ThiF family adenylyltransferase [Bifidobacteriaceae bacterium]|jgi:hypothetical protein|nr:ThiF family adenylyltransferase [Bifidobacteriaceae bacterium]
MKLKNGLRVLWRNRNEIQVGNDPRLAHTFRIEHPREFDVIRLLETEHSPSQLRRQLVSLGGRRERVDQLLEELRDAGLMTQTGRGQTAEMHVPPARRELLAAEAETRALLDNDGWKVLARRSTQRVNVYGLGRTGAQVAMALAASGIGMLQLHDQRPVRPRDRSQVYGPDAVGQPRAEALAEAIRNQGFDCEVRFRGRLARPDAAVLVGEEVSDPTRAAFLTSHRIDHLSVVIGELDITLGPWVPKGSGPCLRCQRLWAVENDPCWPGLATQRFVRPVVASRGEDPLLAQVIGGLAAAHILQGLAGAKPPTHGRTVAMALPTYELTWTDLKEHPKCNSHNPVPRRPVHWSPPPLVPLPPTQ